MKNGALAMARKTLVVMVFAVALLASSTAAAFAESRFVLSEKVVIDTKTKLMWTRDANLGKSTWKETVTVVAELNRKKYAGFSDWRLPSIEELETLCDYAKTMGYDGNSSTRRPAQLLKLIGFHDVQASVYWSSTTNTGGTVYAAWYVSMHDKSVRSAYTYGMGYAWPVRAGK
jgi:hypothetical protein